MADVIRPLTQAEINAKAAEYERLGKFNEDLEIDPPTRPIEPGEVDYLGKKPISKLKTAIANRVAVNFFEKEIKRGHLTIEAVNGIENFRKIAGAGAIITCNHFNPFDNYAVLYAIRDQLGKRRLYKIIREGNYSSFPGLFGFFFRNCNTLPLAQNHAVMREMMGAVDTLLSRGEKILIYPEQGMWRNYRKPRPLKSGAFFFAAKAAVPVLPIFITMRDSDKTDAEGFPLQIYTVNILPPIFPDPALGARDNAQNMQTANFDAWKAAYESAYGTKLEYSTDKQ